MWVNFRTSQRKQTLEQLALRPSRFQHAQLFHTCLSSMSFGCLVWQHTWDSRWTRDADCWFTSSTAQGGGGSFKNRKPIGEVGCCEFPKVVRHWGVLYMLTSKCALRHNGVHFFDISTSKSGPRMVCFVHFDFEMCFAPQRRALSRHINLPKVVRHWGALCILTWKRASRRNGVHFFISHLASWLRTRRFSEPTLRPSGATTFLPFRASASSFFWLFLF